jgi:hypothetical protein
LLESLKQDYLLRKVEYVWNPMYRFSLITFFACPRPRTGFPMSYVMVFSMFICLRWEMIVHFVDIGGIVDHQCLNFLFNKTYVSMSSYVDFPSLRLWKEWFLSWGTKLAQLIIKIKVHIVSWHCSNNENKWALNYFWSVGDSMLE